MKKRFFLAARRRLIGCPYRERTTEIKNASANEKKASEKEKK